MKDIVFVGLMALLIGVMIGLGVGSAMQSQEPQPNYCMELTQGQMPEVCK